MTTAVDIAKPICQAQRAATGVVVAADMTTETQVLFLICANLRNLRIGCVTSVTINHGHTKIGKVEVASTIYCGGYAALVCGAEQGTGRYAALSTAYSAPPREPLFLIGNYSPLQKKMKNS
jgi:hypothetical protein